MSLASWSRIVGAHELKQYQRTGVWSGCSKSYPTYSLTNDTRPVTVYAHVENFFGARKARESVYRLSFYPLILLEKAHDKSVSNNMKTYEAVLLQFACLWMHASKINPR